MTTEEDGRIGQELSEKWLHDRGFKVFQVDWMARKGGEYSLWEAKYQEHFEWPPFDGHGLPIWQVEARLRFQDATGIPAMLLVFEKRSDEAYVQRLDVLDAGEYFDTNGDSPRRVYPLDAFDMTSIPRSA